nr:calcium/sodium antiporter [Ferruginivarius sediminum]
MTAVDLLVGLALLVAGGEGLVRGAVGMARRLGVSPLLIGLTLVGFGTSTPELVTSLEAARLGSPGIAVGNVVGSNIANILLILGLAAIISPLRCDPVAFKRDATMLALATVAGHAVIVSGRVGTVAGLVFLAALAGFVLLTYRLERGRDIPSAELHAREAAAADSGRLALPLSALWFGGGLAVTVLGAGFLVDGAIALARLLSVRESVIGLTIVAVGTSLPELVTSVMAALRRHADVAVGNIVGSNIFNILGILGVTALVHPIDVPADIAAFDIWLMSLVTAGLIALAMTGWRLTRGEGILLVAGFGAYIAWQAFAGVPV